MYMWPTDSTITISLSINSNRINLISRIRRSSLNRQAKLRRNILLNFKSMIVTVAMRNNISTTQVSNSRLSTNTLMYNLRTLNMTFLTPLNNTMRTFIHITTHNNDTRSLNSFRIALTANLRNFRHPRSRTFRAFRTYISVNNLVNNKRLRQKLTNIISRRISITGHDSTHRKFLSRHFIDSITCRNTMKFNKPLHTRLNLAFNIRISTNRRPTLNSRLTNRLMTRARHTTNSSNSFLAYYN